MDKSKCIIFLFTRIFLVDEGRATCLFAKQFSLFHYIFSLFLLHFSSPPQKIHLPSPNIFLPFLRKTNIFLLQIFSSCSFSSKRIFLFSKYFPPPFFLSATKKFLLQILSSLTGWQKLCKGTKGHRRKV